MFHAILNVYAMNLDLVEKLTADLTETELATPIAANGNPPIWILGHLAVSTDSAGQILGLQSACPKEWHGWFGVGSNPEALPKPGPTRGELIKALRSGHERVAKAVHSADPKRLASQHGLTFFEGSPIRSLHDLLVMLLTSHEALHAGQLSAYRRATGRPAIF